MAIINGKVNGTAGSSYRFWIEYETSSNIAENKTIITSISVIAEKIKGTGYYNLGNTTVSLNIDGVDYGAVVSGYDFRKYTRKVLVTINNIEIPHNDDGNKKITISSTWNMDNAPYLTTAEASATFDLPFIPRKSSCNFEDFIIGNNIPVTISRASANFKHTLGLYVNGTLIQTVSNVDTETTITYDADAVYATIPYSTEGTAKITCETFYNGKSLGITETIRKAYINTSLVKPIFKNFSFAEANPTVYNLTGGNNFIKTFSNIKFIVDSNNKAQGQKSASITKYLFTVGTKTSEELENAGTIEKIVNSIDASSLTVTAYDSRSLTTSVSKVINLIDYFPPSIITLEAQRENGVGTNVFLILNAKIYDGDFGNGENKVTYFGYRIKEKEENWDDQTWYDKTSEFNSKMNYYAGDISLDVSDDFKLYSDGTSAGFTLGQAYDIQIKLSDGISTQTFNSIYGSAGITDGKVLDAHFKDENGEYHIGYNGMPSEEYNHTFYGKMSLNGENIALIPYPIGSIYQSTNNTSPSILFGGTWVQLTDRFLVGAGSSYSVGATGGESVVTLDINHIPPHQHYGATDVAGYHDHQVALNGDDGFNIYYRLNWGDNNLGYCISGNNLNGQSSGASFPSIAKPNGNHIHSFTTSFAGGGQSHENKPPYRAVYMWYRSA